MIFEECIKKGYKPRTEMNASQTDGTLAVAIDPYSAGEKCTHQLCIKHKKPYLLIDLNKFHKSEYTLLQIGGFIHNNKIKKLNIAGNGIYSFKNLKDITNKQKFLNNLLYYFLKPFHSELELIQSGGQTGIDEAGLIASQWLNIETKCIAPYGWAFRDYNGIDHYDESKFKERFNLDVLMFDHPEYKLHKSIESFK
jgi:Circularly permutated YpsA SLOG family